MRALIVVISALSLSTVLCFDELEKFENDLRTNLTTYFSDLKDDVNIENLYLNFVCPRNMSARNVSELCLTQMEIVCNNSQILSRMADAWSKFPYTGMEVSTRQEWGSFDECIAIDHQPQSGPRILGKHCTNGLAIPLSADDIYLLSYCVPDACSALDLARLINIDPFPESIIQELVNERVCATKETNRNLDAPAIIIASVFSFFLGLMVFSTAYDVFLHTRKKKNKTPILTSFSVFTNIQKLVQTTHRAKSSSEQILVFHGFKAISMMWIIAGHNAGGFSVIPVVNREEMAGFEYQRYSQYIMSGYMAVDTFFYISGFLMAYQYFKNVARKPITHQILSVPQMLLHRYLRITPALLMLFLYSVYLAKHVGDGPIFSLANESIIRPCKEHWWAVFLYIQNYYNPTDLCMTQTWYLSTDWQLFLVSPLILIPIAYQLKRSFKLALVELLVFDVFVMLLPLFTKLQFRDFDPTNLEFDTHSKLIDYFMGITFGFYLRCQRHKPYVFRGALNYIFWFLALATMFSTVIVLHEINMNHGYEAKAWCNTFIKPVWCLSLTFIVYSCTYGKGGVVNWILTSGFMQIMSKLTYCMYLTHVAVILFWTATRRTIYYFSDFELFFVWCGIFIITILVSVIWTLAFESPLIKIERFLLGGGRQKRTRDEKANASIEVIHKTPYENGLAS